MSVFRITSFISFFLMAALVTFVSRSSLSDREDKTGPCSRVKHAPKKAHRSKSPYERLSSENKNASPRDLSKKLKPSSLASRAKESLEQQSALVLSVDEDGHLFWGNPDMDSTQIKKVLPTFYPKAAVFKIPIPAK